MNCYSKNRLFGTNHSRIALMLHLDRQYYNIVRIAVVGIAFDYFVRYIETNRSWGTIRDPILYWLI